MVQKRFSKTPDGVAVHLTGDIGKAALEAAVSQCNGASCDCDCDSGLKEQVRNVRVDGIDGDVTLTLEGEGLDPEAVAAAMQGCDMEAMR